VHFIRLGERGVNAPPMMRTADPHARFGFAGDEGSPNLSLNHSNTEWYGDKRFDGLIRIRCAPKMSAFLILPFPYAASFPHC
jgi:hypothetical protein